MRSNAMVEDLLRRLPGLRINPDGSIFYNGERIQHLLVDGDDIFGDNPTLVTRNFDASKIARVQIMDRKSDQAQFTGMDDGSRVKTLNLVMKESAKDGYFGRVEVGGSLNGYHSASGAIAGFRDQEQLTLSGISDNTGSPTTGFSSAISDPFGASAGIGIPRVTGGAVHYSNHWVNSDGHLQINYQYGQILTKPVTTTQTTQTLPNSLFDQDQQGQSINQQDQHSAHLVYDRATGDRSAIHVDLRDNLSKGQNQFQSQTSTFLNDTLTNNSLNLIRDHTNNQKFDGDIIWRLQSGKRPENVFAMNVGLSRQNANTEGYLYSLNRYFQREGNIEKADTVDQLKRIVDNSQSFRGGVSYTQPLATGVVLGARYGLSMSNDQPEQNTYASVDRKYNEPVDSLTSSLATRSFNQQATINLQKKGKYLKYLFGIDWVGYDFRQIDKISGENISQHYGNWAPTLQISYTPKSNFNGFFQYSVTNQYPSITQLVSIKNNNDPLHLTIGNPDLRPATNRNVMMGFHWLRSWMINANLNATLTSNSISTRTATDSLGRQVSQSVNVDGAGTASLYISVNHTIGGVDWGFNAINNYSRTVNFVNADLSRNDVFTSGGGFSATRNVVDKFSIQVNTNFTHFLSRSSINSSILQYWTQSHSAMVALYLIPRYEFGTSGTYTWQGKSGSFAGNTSVLLWNSYVSRTFFHDNLTVKATVNNILDQNSGITRTNSANTNTQTATNILGRYWMLSVSYHFDRKFKKKAN